MAPIDPATWSFDAAREPEMFALAKSSEGVIEHAYGDNGTLCGIPGESVEIYRSLFRANLSSACATCREVAAAAPTVPCVQERLFNLITEATPATLRDDLSRALRRGANVQLWINGPAKSLTQHYARLDDIVEGHDSVTSALPTTGSMGLARVEDEPHHYLVILPPDGLPAIGRKPAHR
jgi:hypothetical protein